MKKILIPSIFIISVFVILSLAISSMQAGSGAGTETLHNGTARIDNNTAPIAVGTSKHRINNVAEKYQCFADLCACNSSDPDGNISYIRWAFGDGQYGVSGMKNCQKKHEYRSWNWRPFDDPNGHYVPFNASVTVTDDGSPELNDTAYFNVTVYIAGDANGDGRVNIQDLVGVGHTWGKTCDVCVAPCQYRWDEPEWDEADLNNDCVINIADAAIIGANWGHTAWKG